MTAIVITHKLVENVLRQYDGIIVMHKGRIAEYGTFDELMERKEKFYMLFMDTKQHNKPHVHVYYGDYEAAVGIDGELLAGSAFEPLKDEKILSEFIIFHGVMTWLNGEIDIAPETMYADSYPYTAQNVSVAVG